MTMKKKKGNDNNSVKGKSHEDPSKPAQGDHHIKCHYLWGIRKRYSVHGNLKKGSNNTI